MRLVARGVAAPRVRGHHATTPSRSSPRRSSRLGRTRVAGAAHRRPRASCSPSSPDCSSVDPSGSRPGRARRSRPARRPGSSRATLRTTTNPTVLDAGYKHNVIPDRAEALVDIRTLPGAGGCGARRGARARRRRHRDRDRAPRHRARGAVRGRPRRRRWSRALGRTTRARRCCRTCCPAAPTTRRSRELGIAGYGFAPLRLPADLDFPAMFHGVDERVPLDALVFGSAVLTDLLRNY